MFGIGAICELPISAIPPSIVYGGQSAVLRYGTHSFVTGTTDNPANTFIPGRIQGGLRIGREIGRGPNGDFGSLLAMRASEIELSNLDGALDSIADDWFADGRQISIKVGTLGQDANGKEIISPFNTFSTLYTSVAGAWSLEYDVLRLRLRDQGIALQRPLQELTYQGTGEQQGTADMAGRTLPISMGRCRNVPAQLVDPARLIYQIHDGPVTNIPFVYDSGSSVTVVANYSTYAILKAATIPAGQAATSVQTGFFRLGSNPTGIVTANVDGDIGDPFQTGNWAVTHSAIMRTILDRYAAISAIDESSFDALHDLQPASVGMYFAAGDQSTVESALTRIALSCGAIVGQDRSGLYRVSRLEVPDSSDQVQWSFDRDDIIDINRERLPYGVPFKAWAVGFKRNWRVMSGGDVASIVAASDYGRFLESETRLAVVQSPEIAIAHPTSRANIREGFYDLEEDASAEAERLMALYAIGRALYRVVVKNVEFQIEIGDVVMITFPRWQLDSGKLTVVVAVDDDADQHQTELRVFG